MIPLIKHHSQVLLTLIVLVVLHQRVVTDLDMGMAQATTKRVEEEWAQVVVVIRVFDQRWAKAIHMLLILEFDWKLILLLLYHLRHRHRHQAVRVA
jgi:hypothetical protein